MDLVLEYERDMSIITGHSHTIRAKSKTWSVDGHKGLRRDTIWTKYKELIMLKHVSIGLSIETIRV